MTWEYKTLAVYGSVDKDQKGDFRLIRVDDNGYLKLSTESIPLSASGEVETSEVSSFFPVAGSFQSMSITAASARNGTALTAGVPYIIWPSIDCHIAVGDVTVTAAGTDPHIPARSCFEITLATGETHIAVLKTTVMTPTPSNGIFTIFRSARP